MSDSTNPLQEEPFDEFEDEEDPLSKGVRPVANRVWINFITWLETYHPEVTNLQSISETHFLQLVTEFEYTHPRSVASHADWIASLRLSKRNS